MFFYEVFCIFYQATKYLVFFTEDLEFFRNNYLFTNLFSFLSLIIVDHLVFLTAQNFTEHFSCISISNFMKAFSTHCLLSVIFKKLLLLLLFLLIIFCNVLSALFTVDFFNVIFRASGSKWASELLIEAFTEQINIVILWLHYICKVVCIIFVLAFIIVIVLLVLIILMQNKAIDYFTLCLVSFFIKY